MRMWGGGSGGSGSSGGSGGGGGSADHATEADHATNADNATLADEAKKLTSDSTDWLKIARKDIEQSIAEVWTFVKGIASTLKSYFNGGIEVTGGTKTDTLTATGNATVGGTLGVTGNTTVGGTLGVTGNTTVGGTLGVTGKLNGHDADFEDVTMDNLGTALARVAKIWATSIDATNINAENTTTENLTVTKEAHFFRLVVDELLSNKGAIIITSANCVAEAVAQDSSVAGYYDVYFATVDGNGNSVSNSWRVGDLALCLTFKGEGAGAFSNVRNRYYWRKVLQVESNVTYNDETYHHIRLSNVAGEAQGSTIPAAGDNIVQLGYVGDDAAYRQSAIILSAYPTMDAGVTPPSLAFYKGINDFNLSSHRYTFIDGINNDFVGNFSVIVNGEKTAITTLFATAEGLQAEVTNRQNADAKVLLTAEQLISKLSKETVTVSTNLSTAANWELGIFDSSKAVGSTFAQTKVSSGTYYYCSFRYKSLVALDRDSSSLRAIYNSLDITSAYPDDSRRSTIRPRFLYFDSNSKYIGKSHDGSATGYEGSEAMSYAIPAMENAAYVAIYFTLTPTSVDLSVEPDYEDYVAAMLPKVMKHQQDSSTFQQLFDLIRMQVEECGISISDKKIVSTANQFEWRDTLGNLLLGMDGTSAVFSGTVKAKTLYKGYQHFNVTGGSSTISTLTSIIILDPIDLATTTPICSLFLPNAQNYEGMEVEIFCRQGKTISGNSYSQINLYGPNGQSTQSDGFYNITQTEYYTQISLNNNYASDHPYMTYIRLLAAKSVSDATKNRWILVEHIELLTDGTISVSGGGGGGGDATRSWVMGYVSQELGAYTQNTVNPAVAAGIETCLPLSGGTMTGTIVTPADDDKGIEPATNNYGQVGSSSKKFYRMYASTYYGNSFVKVGSSDSYVLLGGGGTKPLSEFAASADITHYSGRSAFLSAFPNFDDTTVLIAGADVIASYAGVKLVAICFNDTEDQTIYIRWGTSSSSYPNLIYQGTLYADTRMWAVVAIDSSKYYQSID